MADERRGVLAYFLQTGFFLAVYAVCLFAAAGHWDWQAGWILLAINATGQIISLLILWRVNPSLMGDRASLRGKRDLDRVLAGVMALFGPAAVFIVAGLDLRWGWAGRIPHLLQIAGIAVVATGSLITVWAMAVNRFFYGVIRIAGEKGHTTCDRGPYRFVRHPGYLGAVLFDLGAPLLLNSVWAFLPAVATVIAIVVRTGMEDRKLAAGLEGYREYTGRVRFRLLPLVW
jgi:protein-S-isoprenylcysteine O-methyltransferase Ste14